jgi:hypothetical protein
MHSCWESNLCCGRPGPVDCNACWPGRECWALGLWRRSAFLTLTVFVTLSIHLKDVNSLLKAPPRLLSHGVRRTWHLL